MVWCWLGEGVSGLVTASLLVALGDAFRPGADAALLYRTCHALGRETTFRPSKREPTPWSLPATVPVLAFLTGLAEPLRASAIQRLAADAARARAASVASACDRVSTTIALPLSGLLQHV